MATRSRTLLAAALLGLAMFCFPLRAQLDPKLQGSKTDFLNLYQQSTNTKVKPEVLTIFDFSGSMAALMYHPLFVNNDPSDAEGGRQMTFTLVAATAGSNPNNTYTITATSQQNSSVSVSWNLTVNGTVTYGGDSAAGSQSKGSGSSKKYLYTKLAGSFTPSAPFSGGIAYKFSVKTTLNATNNTGTAITLATYASASTSATLLGGVNWTVTGGSRTPTTVSATVTTSGTSWTSSDLSTMWTLPSYNPPIPAVPMHVEASFDPTAPSSHAVTGATYLTAGLSQGWLVKPSGDLVTKADADAASTTSGFTGASSGSANIRNWIRAASHVRFVTAVDNGTATPDTRTVDVPIPWKVTDKDSTGSPLSSASYLDKVIKTNADGTSTTYGSNTNIEYDLHYSLSSGNSVLDTASGDANNTTLINVSYKPSYVSWLFNAKYTGGPYDGHYIVFDAASTTAGGQGSATWGQGYGSNAYGQLVTVRSYNIDGTYTDTAGQDASKLLIPALTRCQAVKRAAIQTWINYQADVIWAYRFLDPDSESNNASIKTIDNNSQNYFHAVAAPKGGNDSGWVVLNNTSAQGNTSTNGNSVTGMRNIASLIASGNTPLTYAMARGLAQFTDPKSVFNAVETGSDAPSQCMNHFLILFTDGVDNNGTGTNNTNGTSPYYIASGSTYKIDAVAGNHSIMASKTSVNYGATYWNLFTYAGIGAHLGDSSLGTADVDYMTTTDPGTTPKSAANPSTFLPLSLYKRNTTVFSKPHLVTTMTVGVSLGGKYTDASSPKRSLFLGAALGDPTLPTWADASTLKPFEWDPSLNLGAGGRKSGTIYFFDGNAPDALVDNLKHAIQSAVGASNINTASTPTTPFIGAATSGEIYLAKFQPPPNGGSIWSGDLLMYGSKFVGDSLQILDKTGAQATTIDDTTAQWSTLKAMGLKNWWERSLYTRIPGSASSAEPGLSTLSFTGDAFTNSTTGLQNFVCQAANNPSRASYPKGSAAQAQILQWVMGGNTTSLDSNGVAKANRPNIMGDIIDSSPAVIEYPIADLSGLSSNLTGFGGDHFRLVLVGTNQGVLHAFGEVAKQAQSDPNDPKSATTTQGKVEELWAFMPTDFLGYLDQLTVTNNPHRFLVDGAPVIYHLDLPPSTGGAADGMVNKTGNERAVAVFGLGKGGRSYYALDIKDPLKPSLRWSLVPDEVDLKDSKGAYVLSSRILSRPGAPTLATVQNVIRNMGFSTCTPGLGRVTITDSAKVTTVRDAVFLGGGFSVPEIEVNFPDSNGKPTPMGRSVIALDVYTGEILAAVDLSGTTISDASNNVLAPGPIARGVVPFEFIINSGMAQRAYFLDYWGGLWSWGCQKTDTNNYLPNTTNANPTYQYRYDTAELTAWTTDGDSASAAGIRLVAKDMNGALVSVPGYSTTQQFYSESFYSTLPAPYRVGSFTGKAKTASGPVPATVGIAIESGDRNNPLDYYYTTSTKPSHHRLSVVFDRQDSSAWGTTINPIKISTTSGNVLDAYPKFKSYQAGDSQITPNTDSYYLAPKTVSNTMFGYYINFPDIDTKTGLIPKGINPPLVVASSLFYSYFLPTAADPCTGGTGLTYTSRICDVLNPIVADTRTGLACTSGVQYHLTGVASDLIPLGIRGALQIGTVDVANPAAGASKTTLVAKTTLGNSSGTYPKARVWRTVH